MELIHIKNKKTNSKPTPLVFPFLPTNNPTNKEGAGLACGRTGTSFCILELQLKAC